MYSRTDGDEVRRHELGEGDYLIDVNGNVGRVVRTETTDSAGKPAFTITTQGPNRVVRYDMLYTYRRLHRGEDL